MALDEEKAWERALMEEEAAAAEADAASRAAMEHKAGVTRRLELQTQMAAKAHMRAAEHDDKLREAEMTQVGSDQQADGVAMRRGCHGAAMASVGSLTIPGSCANRAVCGVRQLTGGTWRAVQDMYMSPALWSLTVIPFDIRVPSLHPMTSSMYWPRAGGGAGLPQQGGRDAAENRPARVARPAQVRLVRAPLERRHLHRLGLQYGCELVWLMLYYYVERTWQAAGQ